MPGERKEPKRDGDYCGNVNFLVTILLVLGEFRVRECLTGIFSLVLMGYGDKNYHWRWQSNSIIQTKLIADDCRCR